MVLCGYDHGHDHDDEDDIVIWGAMIDGAGRAVRGTVTMFVIGVPDYDRDPDDNDDEDGDDDDDAGDCGNGVGYCGI